MEKKNKTRLARAAMTLLFALLTTVGAWAQTPLFSEDFEGGSMPEGWTTDGPGTWSVGTGDYSTSTGAGQGNYNALIKHGTTGNVTKLITPEIDLSSVTSAELSFMHIQRAWSGDRDQLRVYYRTSSDGEWTQLVAYTAAVASWTTEDGIVLPNTNSTYQIAFEMTDNYGYGVGIDNIIISLPATCIKPFGLQCTDATTNTATLSWTNGAEGQETWQICIDGDEDNLITANSNPFTINDLNAGTAYTAKVRTYCSASDQSGWSNEISFVTDCEAISLGTWSENFDGITVTSAYTPQTRTLPVCWSFINTSTYASYAVYPTIYYYSYTDYSHSTPNSLRFYSAYSSYSNYDPQDQYAILPPMENLAGKQISLYARGYDSNSSFKIGTMSDPTDVNTFTLIAEQELTSSYQTDAFEYLIPSTCTDNYVAIMIEAANSSRNYNGVYIDDITIREAPTCLKPTNVELTVSGQKATLTWETGARWSEIVHSMIANTNPGDEPNPVSTENVYTLEYSELDFGDHYFWVRSACGGDDNSEWVGPISCHIGYCTPKPTSHDSNGITGVSFGIGDYVVTNGDGSASIPASAPYYGDYSTMVGAVQAGVESTIAITTGTGSYPYTFVIWVDLDNSLSFEDNEILHIGKASAGNGTYNATITIPATQATGDYRMRIYGADSYFTSFYNGGDTNWEADHDPCSEGSYRHAHDYTLRVLEAPSCLTPTGLTVSDVTAHEATLTWTSDADAWQIQLGEEDPIDVDEATYTFTGLAAETAYSVKVRTNCDGTYSEWTNPVSFTTTVACTAPTGIAVSNKAGHSATVTWDAEEGDVFEYALALSSVTKGDAKVPSETEFQTVSAIPLTLTGLDPETDYTFYLRKNCGSEDGYSQTVTTTFTTTVACPTPTVSVSNITATTAVVNCTNTDAVYFNVSLDELLIGESVTMPYTVTGLTANTGYYVKVQAICGEDEESDWTNPVNFITAEECPDGMVCIGTGTATNNYVPTYTYYNHSLTQQIYTAAELGEAGAFLSVDFRTGNANGTTRSLDIYMVSTDKETFSGNTDWIAVTDADKVFSGNVTFTANDWTTIEFDAPFIYDGTSNVVLVVDDNTESYDNNYPNFYAFNATSQAIRVYSDGTNYDPTAPSSYTGTVLNVKNRVRFAIGEPPASPKPTGLTVTNITSTSATISWNGNSDTYNVYLNKEVATSLFSADFDGVSIPDDFTNDEAYPWTIAEGYIKSSNAGVGSSTSAISVTKSFSTHGTIEFDAECRGEGTNTAWDKCIFSIDGTAMFTYGANVTGWKHYSFPVTEGEHTFTWSYKKDSSTDPTGDYFAVDNIKLNKTFVTSATTFEDVTETAVNPTGLDPETNYIVAVEGVLGGNTSESAVLHFTTLGEATINFAAEGYATYYNRVRDVVLPAGMKAKFVSGGSTTLNYAEIENVVPAGTAMLLQVNPPVGSQPIPIYLARPSVAPIGVTNMLHGSDVRVYIPDLPDYSENDNYYYMLSYDTSGANIGWYWDKDNTDGTGFWSGAHKAWLVLPKSVFQGSGAPFLGLPGWEETTGIVPVGVNPEDGEWYTLQGLKIGKKPTTKGVYIHNGRKVIIK